MGSDPCCDSGTTFRLVVALPCQVFPLVKTVSLGLKAVFSPLLELSGAAGPRTALAVRFPALNEVGLKYSAKLLPGGFRALRLQWFP